MIEKSIFGITHWAAIRFIKNLNNANYRVKMLEFKALALGFFWESIRGFCFKKKNRNIFVLKIEIKNEKRDKEC
jgi:hypothetical protein